MAVELTRWICDCGGLLDLAAQPHFGVVGSRHPAGVWRFHPSVSLPLDDDTWRTVTLGEGGTRY